MGRLISLYDFLMSARNAVVESVRQIEDFNDEQLKGYYDPETGEPLMISFKPPVVEPGQPNTALLDVPLLAISPLPRLGISFVRIALELCVLKVDGVIYVTIPSENDQNPNISSSKVNFDIVFNPSQTDDEFSNELVSVESDVGKQMMA